MQLLILFLTSLLFLAIKVANTGIRLSDSNIYFYTATQMLKGHGLYKDIFFTNFPLFPIISSIYVYFLQRLELYYLTSLLEVIVSTLLIFYIVKEITKNANISLLSSLLYMFSFLILSTSDHQSGVFLATIFSLLAYTFYLKRKFFLTGIFLGCCVMTKAYFLPIPLAFFVVMAINNYRNIWRMFLGSALSLILILLPFVVSSGSELFKDIISYSLVRTQGISKITIFYFFIKHDFLFVVLFIFSLITIKRNQLIGFICLFSSIFILLYQDIYYLYLNLFIPYLCIALANVFVWFKKVHQKYMFYYLASIVLIMSSINIWFYLNTYSKIGRVDNVEVLRSIIAKQKPDYLYGDNDLTPALAYFTNTPLLNTSVDTNPNIFRKQMLNAEALTRKATATKTIIVSYGLNYPLSHVQKPIVGEIFDMDLIQKKCTYLDGIDITAEGIENRINLFKCY